MREEEASRKPPQEDEASAAVTSASRGDCRCAASGTGCSANRLRPYDAAALLRRREVMVRGGAGEVEGGGDIVAERRGDSYERRRRGKGRHRHFCGEGRRWL